MRPKLLAGLGLGALLVLATALLLVSRAERGSGYSTEWAGPDAATTRDAGDGYVTTGEPPKGLTPATDLSPEERRRNFEALARGIESSYAMFEIKHLDWPQVVARYRPRVAEPMSTEEYYELLWSLVNELQDTHSWIQGRQNPYLRFGPRLVVEPFGPRVYVTFVPPGSAAAQAGVQVGWEVAGVDGLSLPQQVAQVRPRLKALSSDHAGQRQAYRAVLRGDRGTTCAVTFRLPHGELRRATLQRDDASPGRAPWRCPGEVSRGRFVAHGRLASGLGYIRIASFSGRQEISQEFSTALEQLRGTRGLVLDVRGNEGGFGNAQPEIVGHFLTQETPVAISYSKQPGAGNALTRHDAKFRPTGPWQYTKPVALLVDQDTGSAADLFVCYLRAAPHVTTVGSPTHGNLSGVGAYVVLPCYLVVRVSNGYVCDAQGAPIEGRGNVPDIRVEPTIEDLLAGRDPVLDRAEALLLQRTSAEASG